MAWTIYDEKKEVFKTSQQYMERFRDVCKKIEEKSNGSDSVPNIGVTYNNKLIYLDNLFSSKGLSFYNSPIKNVIIRYLTSKLGDALDLLSSYASLFEQSSGSILMPWKVTRTIDTARDILKKYEELDDELFDFSIEKDIQKAVDYDIDLWNKIGNDGGYNLYEDSTDSIEEAYNSELSRLGINVKINIPSSLSKCSEPIKNSSDSKNASYDLLQLANSKILEVEMDLASQYSDMSHVYWALKSRILDYAKEAADAHSNGDEKSYLDIVGKLRSFDYRKEMRSSVGRYVSYWADVNSFHNVDSWTGFKEELISLGLSELIPEIEQDLGNGLYADYVKKRNSDYFAYNSEVEKTVQTEGTAIQ